MRSEFFHFRAWGCMLALLLAAGAQAQSPQSAPGAGADAFTTAHAMHERLLQVPLAQRTPADYEKIVDVLRPLWSGADANPSASDAASNAASDAADSARFQAASVYVAEARDLRNAGGWKSGSEQLLELLHQSPYTAYRRNAEWALAQIQIYHLHEPGAAAVWLRDFERRYPADPRLPVVKLELSGRHGAEPGYLESPPTPAVPVLPAAVAAASAAAHVEAPPAGTGDAAAAAGANGGSTASAPDGAAEHTLAVKMGVVRGIQVFTNAHASSVVIALSSAAARVSRGALPKRHLVYFDIANPRGAARGPAASLRVGDGRVETVSVADHGRFVRVVVGTSTAAHADQGRVFPNPDRLIVGITGGTASAAANVPAPPAAPVEAAWKRHEQSGRPLPPIEARSRATSGSDPAKSGEPPRPAAKLANGGTSLSRALGLKLHRIVLDAGHGGHDTGTIGPGDLEEKNVVLDVTLRLGKLLQQRLGVDVIYTRDNDTFIPLQERTAIAIRAHADLFVSIHANASADHAARGVETYYLDLTNNAQALAVAARENAGSELSMHDLHTLVEKIAQYNKMQESDELALDLDRSLARATGVPDRGVKTAPFVVLIGAPMPSVLAEISFLSNPTDDRDLRQAAYRQKIAEALYQGVLHYMQSLGAPAAGAGVAMLNDAGGVPVQ